MTSPAEAPLKLLKGPDGYPVALHDFGGVGPVLLLGHGNGLNSGMWAGALPLLRERFHCFGLDLRGHGSSRPVEPGYPVLLPDFATDIVRCVEELGDGPILYAAHSLSAAAGVVAALEQPDLFSALWLFEPVLVPAGLDRPDGGEPSMLIEMAKRRRMTFDSIDDVVTRFSSKPPFSNCHPDSIRAYVEIGSYPVAEGIRLSCEGIDEARVFGANQPIDFDQLSALRLPVLVAVGGVAAEVHAVPTMVAPLIAKAIPDGLLERHDDLSHMGPLEDPNVVAHSIINFFGP